MDVVRTIDDYCAARDALADWSWEHYLAGTQPPPDEYLARLREIEPPPAIAEAWEIILAGEANPAVRNGEVDDPAFNEANGQVAAFEDVECRARGYLPNDPEGA